MTQERENNDQDFTRMLETVEEIPLKLLENWHRGDEVRIEMVAKALAVGEVDFYIGTCLSESGTYDNVLRNLATGHFDVPDHVPLIGYQQVAKIKNYISAGLYVPWHFMVNAASLREWINKNFQPVPDSPKGFMSERLRLAVEISNKLYPEGYEVTRDRTNYSVEKGRIEKELDKTNIKNKSDLKEWMSKIINPETYSSVKK